MMTALRIVAAVAFAVLASPAVAETVAITNARIFTMGPAGEITNGGIILRDGIIVAVGPNVRPPSGARVIDAEGAMVTPGLIAASTVLGGLEINSLSQTDDVRTHNGRLGAGLDVALGLNPDSVLIPTARLGGVTRAVVTPDYDDGEEGRDLLFAGQAAVISLGQGANIVTRSKVGMVLDLGEDGARRAGGSRAAEMGELSATLEDVRFYRTHRADYDAGATRDLLLSRADLEALIPVVEGRMPLIISVHRAADIRLVLALARDQKLKVILSGVEEGWRVASEIAAARVPVLVNPTSDLPTSFETLASTLENVVRLDAAGVQVAIVSVDPAHRVRELRYNAGRAVARGLPYAAAIEAITLAPARVFGISDRFGSIEPGKVADLVIWDGDPLEIRGEPRMIFIDGVVQPLRSRALDLRDRYLGGKAGPAD